ncbi:WD repeat-containing protein 18 [Tribolium castaneum]|uniref:WD repeat-containing protein 18-like Protein n=1 Tax=Tribolium castaneum TaxID=7070 RepID=D2A5P7_TRICA|nr:PREDICTED: WD repeat-containing protein 18 [Tribolium castaneum]EFA05044.1 WD repeat-containing protein 18-like Protein [Tribolium castaneum]|eukprot:XP_972631.1 PREDICTED: WD repeat-containing protein 18 [Tribolium castaneum]
MDVSELILTTCRHTQQWSAALWDSSTGSIVHCYKNGGVVAPKTLNLLGDDYLLTSDDAKPITHVWCVNSQEVEKKMSTIHSEKITAMSVCPQSCYIAAGIGTKLHLWHLPSGKLLSIQKKNYQPITCAKFSNDGAFVVVSGQDGMLVVYSLASLVSLHNNFVSQSGGQVEPIYTKHDHSLPINDLHVGNFGPKSRLATVSSDHTCKIYVLSTGTLLLNLIFDSPLTSVIFDGPCWSLFLGHNSGRIQQFYLKEPPRGVEHHVSGDLVFQGHSKRVTCLDMGAANGVLVSGSDDCFVFVWEIASRQILRRIEHKGAITNVKCVLKHENFFVQNLRAKVVVRNFDRGLIQGEDFVLGKIQQFDLDLEEGRDEGAKDVSSELKNENARLRSVNKQLYDTAIRISRKYNNF